MKKIIFLFSKLSKNRLMIAYLFIILVLSHNISGGKRFGFLIYALLIFLIIHLINKKGKFSERLLINSPQKYHNFFVGLLIFSFALILVVRFIPFLHHGEAPLGYDTGFYVRDITQLNSSIFGERGIYPEKIFYFILIPLNLLGISSNYSLHFIYLLIQFLLAGSLYFLFNSSKFKYHFEYACIAVFVFATSITQFHAYWSMFPKQLLAISLFLISIALILRQSYLAVLTITFGALVNVPIFAVFLVGTIIYFIIRAAQLFFQKICHNPKLILYSILAFSLLFFLILIKGKFWFGQSSETYNFLIIRALSLGRWLVFFPLLILLIQLFLRRKVISNKILFVSFSFFIIWNIFYWGQDYRSITNALEYLFKHKGLAVDFPAWKMGEIKGIFINIYSFRDMNMSLIPFALFVFLQPAIWKQSSVSAPPIKNFLIFIYVMFFTLFILVSFPFIYQNRFIIVFDIFFIFFTVPVLFLLINYYLSDRLGLMLIIAFLIISTLNISYLSWQYYPQLYSNELQELKNLVKITEKNALILATDSIYTPWVQGFSGRQAHGPGYGGDTWGLSDWINFWVGSDDELRYQLLNTYDQPLYLFIGRRQPAVQAFQQFIKNSNNFKQISPHIWKYNEIYD